MLDGSLAHVVRPRLNTDRDIWLGQLCLGFAPAEADGLDVLIQAGLDPWKFLVRPGFGPEGQMAWIIIGIDTRPSA